MMLEHESMDNGSVGGPEVSAAAGPLTGSVYEYTRPEPLPMKKKAKRRGIASPFKGAALPVKRLRVASQRYPHSSDDSDGNAAD